MVKNKTDPTSALAAELEADLIRTYGTPLISGEALLKILGFTSNDAFRQALSRGKVPVVVFPLENRRGKYALAKDLARWLAEVRCSQLKKSTSEQ